MKKYTWIIAAASSLLLIILLSALLAPRQPDTPTSSIPSTTPPTTMEPTTAPPAPGKVVVYQCDPALAEAWQALAERYTSETGTEVTVLTAENGDCSSSLAGYMESGEQPTIFCLHGSQDLNTWGAQCLDLTASSLDAALWTDSFSLMQGEKMLGIASNVESYGIIYNPSLLARAGYTDADIKDFSSLRDIAKFITDNQKVLGFSAFASPNLTDTSHGSLLCLLAGISGSGQDLRSFWDLYIGNTPASSNISNTVEENPGLTEFLQEKAVFYLGGTWSYEALSEMEDYNLRILPVYSSKEQENLGLYYSCTGYWCVNAEGYEPDIIASVAFLEWLVTAKEESSAPVDTLNLLAPYRDAVYFSDPLEKQVREYMASGRDNIRWNSCDDLLPASLKALGAALATYAASPTDENWAAVEAHLSGQEAS